MIAVNWKNLTRAMPYVYVIKSLKNGSFYIGKTSNLVDRLHFHNTAELNVGVSKNGIPLQYFYTLEVEDAMAAGKIENHIKKMKRRKYITDLIKYPEISKKLIKKYS